MTTHPSFQEGTSQNAIILEQLQKAHGEWVPLTTLHVYSGSLAVHSRIHDLRRKGFTILHKNERVKHRVHSFYQLTTTTP